MKVFVFFGKVFLWLILILGVFSYLISYILSDNYLKVSQRDDTAVVATVVDVVHEINTDTADDYYVIVSYTYNGETYKNNLGSLGQSWQSKIGQTITLRINPDNPEQTLDDSRSSAIGMAISGAFLFAAMIGVINGIRGYNVPVWLQSVLPERICKNMRSFVVGWLGLLVFAVAMAVYAICFGVKLGNIGVILCLAAVAGAAMFVVLPNRHT